MQETKKRTQINFFKKELEGKSYSELNAAAIEVAFSVMATAPEMWQQHLKTNRKHAAIMELMHEIKNVKQ